MPSGTNATGSLYANRQGSAIIAHTYPVQFNTPGVASGILLDTIKSSATNPVRVAVSSQVLIPFNAATTNVFTVGTTTAANEWLGSNDLGEASAGFYPVAREARHEWFQNVAAATTTGAATQYDLTGGAGVMASVTSPAHPRNIRLTITDANASITAYSITVAGLNQAGIIVSETFTFTDGLTPSGSVIFSTVSSVTITSVTGAGAGDVLDLGFGVKIGLAYGWTGLIVDHVLVDGTREAAAAVDAVYGSVTFTTAPNATRDYEVFYAANTSHITATFRLTADTGIYTKYTQSGTAATQGSAIITVIEYAENNLPIA